MSTCRRRQQAPPVSGRTRLWGWLKNPWGRPRFLVLVTWAYIVWSIVPVLIAVQFSFNDDAVPHRLAGLLDPLVLGTTQSIPSGTTQPCATLSCQSLKLAAADV